MSTELQKTGYLVKNIPVIGVNAIEFDIPKAQPKLIILLSYHAASLYVASKLGLGEKNIIHVAIGKSTASVLESNGYLPLVPSTENSEGILALDVVNKLIKSDIVWLITGRRGLGLIEQKLSVACTLLPLIVYERVSLSIEGIVPDEIGAIVVGSAQGLSGVNRFWKKNNGDLSVCLVVPSTRIERKAIEMSFTRLINAESANPQAIVRCLEGATVDF